MIKARSATVAYAVSTIFCFNIAAVLLFPPLGHLLHLSQHAVVVKLVRTLMIVPITLVLGVLASKRQQTELGQAPVCRAVRLVPWFLVGFVVLVTANTAGLVPHAALAPGRVTATFLITVALTAIGLGTDVAALRRAGARPLLLGGLLWVVVAASTAAGEQSWGPSAGRSSGSRPNWATAWSRCASGSSGPTSTRATHPA